MSEGRLSQRMPAGRIAYVGGRYVRHGEAHVHIEDRGLQFADSVYEAFALIEGHILDEKGHLDRLERSLRELQMPMPLARSAVAAVVRETVRRNRVRDGFIYLQVTRGAVKRDHAIPTNAHPMLMVTVRPVDMAAAEKRRAEGVAVATTSDIRWGRCDIKTTSLTANVLAKTEGRAKGAYEVWLVDKNDMVTEGASTSAWIVTKDGRVVTRDLHANILPGVTRATLIRALGESGSNAKLEERGFSVTEARAAQEAFITAASAGVMPVVKIDGKAIGDGKPGPVARRMQALYSDAAINGLGNAAGVDTLS